MSHKHIRSCRRKTERKSTGAPVLVHCRGSFQRAKVVDYSEAGLQLEGTFGLIPTDLVAIEFVSGVRVPGKVEWSLGVLTGVVFSERLDPSHQAMVELARNTG